MKWLLLAANQSSSLQDVDSVVNSLTADGELTNLLTTDAIVSSPSKRVRLAVNSSGDGGRGEEAVKAVKKKLKELTDAAAAAASGAAGDRSGDPVSREGVQPVLSQPIADKSLADCVEALIGCFLREGGPMAALKFMAFVNIDLSSKNDGAFEAGDTDNKVMKRDAFNCWLQAPGMIKTVTFAFFVSFHTSSIV